jgi:hypothetical protein
VAAPALVAFAVGDAEVPASATRGHPESGDCDVFQLDPFHLCGAAKGRCTVPDKVVNTFGNARAENLCAKEDMMVTHVTLALQKHPSQYCIFCGPRYIGPTMVRGTGDPRKL